MIKLNSAVIVEGKYDKIRLQNIIDALIIPTNGYQIFKDKEKLQLIRMLADKNGIIILTDSDSAGMLIRSHLKGMIDDTKIKNVYLPQIVGKERRKRQPSAEGFLGVEGTDDEIIIKALELAGVTGERSAEPTRRVTKSDMFLWGLSGSDNATDRRRKLQKYLNLPENIPANSFLDLINSVYGYEKFSEVINRWKQDTDRN